LSAFKKRIRASVVCIHGGRILVFKGIDPHSEETYWFLPGGKIEDGEKPWECAERETFEETGYRVGVIKESEIIKKYEHPWNGENHDCATFFYIGILSEPWRPPVPVHDADYNKGAEWLPLEIALEFFSYKKEIRDAVIELSETE